MQILPENKASAASAGSGLAQGFGQGFMQQFTPALEAQRKAGALQNIGKQGGSPLEMISQLTKARYNPQEIQQILPYIQSQLMMQEQQKLGQGVSTPASVGTAGTIPGAEIRGYGSEDIVKEAAKSEQPQQKRLVTKELEKLALNPPTPLKPDDINRQAVQLQKEQPATYPTFDAARKGVIDRWEAQNQQYETAKQELDLRRGERDNLKKSILARAGMKLNAQGLPEIMDEATGNMINNVADKAESELAEGKGSVEDIAEKYGEKIKRFADDRLRLETESKKRLQNPSSLRDFYKQIQKKYSEIGAEKTMVNDLITNGKLSRPVASQYTYPLSSEKGLNKYIEGIKKIGVIKPGLNYEDFQEAIENQSRAVADKLPTYLTEKDSILSIGQHIKDKGYDPDLYLDEIRKLNDAGLIKLTPDQQDEVSSVATFSPFMPNPADIWLNLFK